MVKLGKHKFKALKKLTNNKNITPSNVTNKIIKKKQNVEKRVSFQKEVLLKETVKSEALVKNIKNTDLILDELLKKPEKKVKVQEKPKKPKLKAVEKHKKRQQTQIKDTKLLLKLMKKK